MKLHLTQTDKRVQIKSVGADGIRVGETIYTGSVLINTESGVTPWRPQNLTMVNDADVLAIIELAPEVVLLGTGATHRWPPARRLALFGEKRIGIEVMTTAAACRTFNVLASEGRHVVAAALAVNPAG